MHIGSVLFLQAQHRESTGHHSQSSTRDVQDNPALSTSGTWNQTTITPNDAFKSFAAPSGYTFFSNLSVSLLSVPENIWSSGQKILLQEPTTEKLAMKRVSKDGARARFWPSTSFLCAHTYYLGPYNLFPRTSSSFFSRSWELHSWIPIRGNELPNAPKKKCDVLWKPSHFSCSLAE